MKRPPWKCCSFLVAVCLVMTAKAVNESHISRTMKELFHEDKYDKRIRPHKHDSPLQLKVDMSVARFGVIREVEMDFTVDLYFRQDWNDQRLKHSLGEPIVLMGADKKHLWLPDTFIKNLKVAISHNIPSYSSRVTISPNGDVSWSTRITVTTGCHMDLRDYPLDQQKCNITLLSYAYTRSEVNYKWNSKTIAVFDGLMNEFEQEGITTASEEYTYPSGSWTQLTASFGFKRRLGYAFGQIYVPTVMIVMLSWLSFWINENSVPARVALGATTVLTIVTLMGSFRNAVPKVSYVKALDVFFVVSFLFVFGVVLEYITVLFCQRRKQAASEERQEKKQHGVKSDAGSEDEETEQTAKENSANIKSPAAKSTGCFTFLDFKKKTNIIDRFSRILFPCAFLAFNVIYWFYYSFANFYGKEKKNSVSHS